MLDRILIGASSTETTDANFKNVTLLLHGDGSNGAQNNTFIDSSTNNFTITRNGNTTQGSFSPYGDTWSNYFDGSGDYIYGEYNAAFGFGTGDYTIEGWFYPTVGGVDQRIVWFDNDRNNVDINTSNQIFFYDGSTRTFGTVNLNAWNHFAISRSSGTVSCYLNGVRGYNASETTNTSARTMFIGANDLGNGSFNGYISNVRVVKGTAVYSGSTITIPTAPLTSISGTSLLTCAYNRFRDGSANNFSITPNGNVKVTNFAPFAPSAAYSTTTNGGSAYFDGSGDWLNTPSSLSLASGDDFTLEFWLYPFAAFSSNRGLVACSGARFGLITEGGSIYFLSNSTEFDSSVDPFPGAWNHIALTRTSGTIRLFLNGKQIGTRSSNTDNWSSQGLRIGSNSGGEIIPQCYMSDVRWATTSFYSSAFTPPTAPLTAASGTQVLVGCKNAAIFDNSMKNDLETVGNAQISTSVKKFGTGSMAFDGSGDYLVPSTATADHFAFGSGDFTIEFWLNPSSNSIFQIIYDGRPEGSPSANAPLILMNGQTIYYQTGGSTRITGSNLSTSTWYHIALARSGTSTKMFVNGTQVGSTYTDSTVYTNSAARPVIGGDGNAPGFNSVNGYIDDLRVTKGVARYTANFTAPTAPFPNK